MPDHAVVEQPVEKLFVPPSVYPLVFVSVSTALAKGAEYLGVEERVASVAAMPAEALAGIALITVQLVFVYATFITAKARLDLGVPYPHFYPAKADGFKNAVAFQTTVRAQHNILEHIPLLLAKAAFAAFIAGSPYTAAAVVLVFAIARVGYVHAYTSGAVINRLPFFALSIMADFVNMGIIILFVIRSIRPGLI
jgi:uncharacterized membrane protein YecN with MAPEG domain